MPYFQGLQTYNLVQPQNPRSKLLRDTGDLEGPARAAQHPPRQDHWNQSGGFPVTGEPSPSRHRANPLPRSRGLLCETHPVCDCRTGPKPRQVTVVSRVCHFFHHSNPDDPKPSPARRGPASPKPKKFPAALRPTLGIPSLAALWSGPWPARQLTPRPSSAQPRQNPPRPGAQNAL